MTKDEQIKILKEQRAVLRASNEKFRKEFIDKARDWLAENYDVYGADGLIVASFEAYMRNLFKED